jgi:hypothetical protein
MKTASPNLQKKIRELSKITYKAITEQNYLNVNHVELASSIAH